MGKEDKQTVEIKPFIRKVVKQGKSYGITIPKFNIRAGIIVPGKEYEIHMFETKSKEKEADEQ